MHAQNIILCKQSLAENCKEEYADIGWRNELCSQNYQLFKQVSYLIL